MEIPPSYIGSLTRILRATTAAYIHELPQSNAAQIQIKVDLSAQVDGLLALWKSGAIDPQKAMRDFVESQTPAPTDPLDGQTTVLAATSKKAAQMGSCPHSGHPTSPDASLNIRGL